MATVTLEMVGQPRARLFGLGSDEALARQVERIVLDGANVALVARADVALTTPTLQWLVDNPGRVLVDESGAALAGATEGGAAPLRKAVGGAAPPPAPFIAVGSGQSVFVRALRRREVLAAIDLLACSRRDGEWLAFTRVYKGVTDAVTKWIWPIPAFHVVRVLAAYRIHPNAVTAVGIMLTMLAAYAFAVAAWSLALWCAWVMTFLDTVDGKLARVTHTSSKLGDWLDHGTDVIHPPIWWACAAFGLAQNAQMPAAAAWETGAVIIACYFAGRGSEGYFKRSFGFNQYIWRPFDAGLRLVIARRNPNLVILTAGALAGSVANAFSAVALWSIATIGLQCLRSVMAAVRRASGQPVRTYFEE